MASHNRSSGTINFPVQIQFRGMASSEAIWNKIWDRVERLERFYNSIMFCRVIVSLPHRHHRFGKTYHIQIEMQLKGGNIYITSEPELNPAHADVTVAIRDAFDAARRKIEDFGRRQRRQGMCRHTDGL